MKYIFFLLLLAFLTSSTLVLNTPALAASKPTPTQTIFTHHFYLAADCGTVKTSIDYGCDASKGGAIYGFLRAIIKFASGLVGLVVILMLIIGGIRYITSAGDPKLVVSAKNQIVNAVIGLVLFSLMLAILNFLLPGGIIG